MATITDLASQWLYGTPPSASHEASKSDGMALFQYIDYAMNAESINTFTIEQFAGSSVALVGNGTFDETAAFEAACQAAAAVAGQVLITPGKHRITSKRQYTSPFKILGVGTPSPYKILADNSNLLSVKPADYYKGPWLYFDHTDVGIEFYGSAGPMSQVQIENVGFTRPQTTPVTGTAFVPIDQSWDIVISNCWATLSDLIFAGTCRGIYHDYGGYGRLHARHIRGQCLKCLIHIETTNDDCRLEDIGQGNIWCFHPEVVKYMLANLETIVLKRVDNTWLRDVFSIAHKRGVAIYSNANGTVSKLKLDNADLDLGNTAIYIDAGCTGVTGQISNLAAQGPNDDQMVANAGSLVEDHGTSTRLQFDSPALSKAIDHAFFLAGTGAFISVDSPIFNLWDRVGDGDAAIRVEAGNTMSIRGKLLAEGGSSAVFSIASGSTVIYDGGAKSGTAALGASSTTVTVSHGQIMTPTAGQVRAGFAGNPYNSSKVWITSITSTQMTINVDVAPGTATSLWWEADCSRV